ncbi:lipopolysaccharide biosynthesis protein [Mucilaginibacter terrenus]|uniref:Lipopolysaccharide biosynthesis protein n=1 Tax=Mucilaginibacter terrenus TaxID=2482727 RepID=A0A3E2NQB6_9SPHI|nr:glycosyl transferase family 90 [Mucilaginibacter terrenus]RFZ83185.1 lipopolysaccharide biosynthesis protein [Mucilaginibacter terrenus]
MSFGGSIKKVKAFYYVKNILRQAVPSVFYRSTLASKLNNQRFDEQVLINRLNYYNKLNKITPVGSSAITLNEMPIFKSPKAYNFDTYEFTRYFNKGFKANFLFGDVTHVADVPTIQKSRPIGLDNHNAVLLKLDKNRHFNFIKDNKPYLEKKDLLIGRGAVTQPHRILFMEKHFNNPFCDLGQVNNAGGDARWIKPKLSIKQHLQYKFILSLEGNDVATNLKWIMSSNSIAVMPKPRYETWFMEGRLIPDHHYILIKDDYSDLDEKLTYYLARPQAALNIIGNAKSFVKQFLDKEQEDIISLLVLDKYFQYTGQKGE